MRVIRIIGITNYTHFITRLQLILTRPVPAAPRLSTSARNQNVFTVVKRGVSVSV